MYQHHIIPCSKAKQTKKINTISFTVNKHSEDNVHRYVKRYHLPTKHKCTYTRVPVAHNLMQLLGQHEH